MDESTLPDNNPLLLGCYLLYIKDENMCQELFFATYLENRFFRMRNPWKNIVSVATDGAPSMVGRYRDFIAHLKRQLPEVLVIHCDAVNKIRSNSLNSRLFAQLCEENDESLYSVTSVH
ncbi:unnamed protein product [Psylliodes chrysocephalus]|uniref:Uncharacterized protein n=1 Tax=Psylliodes chrysocephalus TaxID=3402493 RepID=A0A9P0GD03_9CUCU|nr:unnamed protein product [Psylliodes chrysocephala]